MNDHDRRQLATMRKQLNAYDAGEVEMSTLISDLEVLQGLLETMPQSWSDDFNKNWGILEEVYSVAVVRRERIESTENKALTAPALERIRTMIDEALGT